MAKCCECGFLCVRMKEDNSLGEANAGYRNEVIMPVAHGHELHEVVPLCFARQPYMLEAVKGINIHKAHEEVKAIIHEDIDDKDCKEFIDWQQGFTPKEHREMIDRKWQQEYEERNRKSDRKWRIIELAIAVSVGAAIAIVAAFIQRGG